MNRGGRTPVVTTIEGAHRALRLRRARAGYLWIRHDGPFEREAPKLVVRAIRSRGRVA